MHKIAKFNKYDTFINYDNFINFIKHKYKFMLYRALSLTISKYKNPQLGHDNSVREEKGAIAKEKGAISNMIPYTIVPQDVQNPVTPFSQPTKKTKNTLCTSKNYSK